MSQFSFPLLSNTEIISCLAEFDLPMEEAQLQKPTHDAMKLVYESVVHVLVGVSREELQQPVFSATDELEFPELHDESIPCVALLHHLSLLMGAAGVKDFGLKDIFKPEAQRTRRNLSAIINFAKFREEKLVPYTELQDQIEASLAERDELEAVNLQMTSQLKKLRAERASEEPEVERLEGELSEYAERVQELNEQQSKLQAEVRSLKQTSNELADKQAETKFALLSERQQSEKLSEQIVQSPERLQRNLENMQQTLERERGLAAAAEKRMRELQARMDTATKMEKEIGKTLAAVETAKQEVERKKEVSRQVKDAKAAAQRNENELQHLASTTQHHRRQQAAVQERIRRIEAQGKLKCEAAASTVEESLKDKEALQAEAAAAQAKASANEAMVNSLEQQAEALRSSHKAQVKRIAGQYEALLTDVTNYNGMLVDTMQAGPDPAAREGFGS